MAAALDIKAISKLQSNSFAVCRDFIIEGL